MAASRRSREVFPWPKVARSTIGCDFYGIPDNGVVDEDGWWEVAGIPKELKLFDEVETQLPVAAGVVFRLNDITQGDDYNQRDGRKINLVSLHMQWHYLLAATAVAIELWHAIVFDCRGAAALPSYLDIFTVDTVQGPFINPSNRERFKILYIWRGSIGPLSTVAPVHVGSRTKTSGEVFLDFTEKDWKSIYDAAGSAVYGSVYLCSKQSSATAINLVTYTRIRYTE